MTKTASFSLPNDVVDFIDGEVNAGRFGSPSEVVQTAVRLLEEQAGQIERLRQALIEGEESGPPRPFDAEAFFARMHTERARRR